MMYVTTIQPDEYSCHDLSVQNKLSVVPESPGYDSSRNGVRDNISEKSFTRTGSCDLSDSDDSGEESGAEFNMRIKNDVQIRVTSPECDKTEESDTKNSGHICPICTKELPSQHEFTLHIRSHNDIKNSSDPVKSFKCKVCYKVLSSSSSLDRHVLVHSGERPFTCRLCGGTFTTNGNMHRHMRTHGESAYHETEDLLQSPRKLYKRKAVSDSECTPSKRDRSDFSEHGSASEEWDSSGCVVSLNDGRPSDPDSKERPKSVGAESGTFPKGTTKDLADIKSILHVTTTGNILPDLKEYNCHSTMNSSRPSSYLASPQSTELSCLDYGDDEEEPMEDPISAEIREMKMRGEFPCRICSMILPNLRALKGHNRTHLQSAPYECNMCPYSSHDKNTLMRHMRTHNGERPYECKICHYAFTTKANCERHLKNRHGKVTRDEIRDNLLHQPSESDQSVSAGDVCKVEFPLPKPLTQHGGVDTKPARCKVCKHYFPTKQHVMRHALKQHPNVGRDMFVLDTSDGEEPNSSSSYSSIENPLSSVSLMSLSGFDLKRIKAESESGYVSSLESSLHTGLQEEPLDLSCGDRPLDLSTRCKTEIDDSMSVSTPLSAHKYNHLRRNLPFSGMSPIIPSLVFSPDRKSFPVFLSQLANQYGEANRDGAVEESENGVDTKVDLRAPNPLSLITPHLPYAFHAQWSTLAASAGAPIDPKLLSGTSPKNTFLKCVVKSENPNIYSNSPLSAESHDSSKENSPENKPDRPPVKSEPGYDDPSLKVVIKNGILMKKQKQRRYRTERPFACEHCSARFTLRSNMERHIKQQHPQFWCQKPRGGRRNPLTPTGQMVDIEDDKLLEESEVKCESTEENPEGDFSKDASNDTKVEADASNDADSALVIDEEEYIDVERPDVTEDGGKSGEENCVDLASVSKLIDNASTHNFQQYFQSKSLEEDAEGNHSDNDRESATSDPAGDTRKKSAYSTAPHRVSCPFCLRKFPWTSSLRRHILTHTGQKPYKCPQCSLWFTTKSNCDRHMTRKHGNNADNSYTMRNVPERPYKCNRCPSSTFSTLSNLKKHQLVKHLCPMGAGSGTEDLDGVESGEFDFNQDSMSDCEEKFDSGLLCRKCNVRFVCPKELSVHIEHHHVDLPFKCHLCEESYSERNGAISHLKECHEAEFNILVSKGALEALDESAPEKCQEKETDPEMLDSLRGRFPDYVNRKVSCCFCLRRFWSAEDLRRHMRTHTGEKPFSCSICRRKFTLKHSMIRHRKKHLTDSPSVDDPNVTNNRVDSDNESFDSCRSNSVDGNGSSPRMSPGLSDRDSHSEYSSSSLVKPLNNNVLMSASCGKTEHETVTCDLIGNLLGIKDSSLIDEVLISKSADDAAKLLGVQEKPLETAAD